MASAAAPSPDLGDRGETVLLSRSNKAAEVPVSCRALRLLHLASLPPPPLFVPTWPPRLGFRGPAGRARARGAADGPANIMIAALPSSVGKLTSASLSTMHRTSAALRGSQRCRGALMQDAQPPTPAIMFRIRLA